MTPPRIEWKINLGHVITLAVLSISFMAGHAARDAEVNAHLDMIAKRLDETNARLDRIEQIHMIGGRP